MKNSWSDNTYYKPFTIRPRYSATISAGVLCLLATYWDVVFCLVSGGKFIPSFQPHTIEYVVKLAAFFLVSFFLFLDNGSSLFRQGQLLLFGLKLPVYMMAAFPITSLLSKIVTRITIGEHLRAVILSEPTIVVSLLLACKVIAGVLIISTLARHRHEKRS